jgi:hypothetical protein
LPATAKGNCALRKTGTARGHIESTRDVDVAAHISAALNIVDRLQIAHGHHTPLREQRIDIDVLTMPVKRDHDQSTEHEGFCLQGFQRSKNSAHGFWPRDAFVLFKAVGRQNSHFVPG